MAGGEPAVLRVILVGGGWETGAVAVRLAAVSPAAVPRVLRVVGGAGCSGGVTVESGEGWVGSLWPGAGCAVAILLRVLLVVGVTVGGVPAFALAGTLAGISAVLPFAIPGPDAGSFNLSFRCLSACSGDIGKYIWNTQLALVGCMAASILH